MINALLRYDDYSAISDTALERQVLEAVAGAGLRIVISVIPFVADLEWKLRGPIGLRPLPPDKVELLKEFVPQKAEVALHGYAHQALGRISGMTEFGGRVAAGQQLARLRDGKAYLEDQLGDRVKAFVPPWNDYGIATVAAIREAGFDVLSGDAAHGPVEEGMAYIPCTCALPRLGPALKAAATDAKAFVCVLLHEYDFEESRSPAARISLRSLEEALRHSRQTSQWLRFQECLAMDAWTAERARLNQELRRALRSPLRHFSSSATADVYWSNQMVRRKLRFLRRAVALVRFFLKG
jgi:peptidoglycan/xylan/chitin deacetylase (PgdA/CDA1 family)